MDFFQHQEQARKRTVLLVVLYTMAIAVLVVSLYAIVAVIAAMAGGEQYTQNLENNFLLDPVLLLCTVGGVLLLVLGGSAAKIAQLSSGGGKAVAEMLGGRKVTPSTIDPAERRLYNVVEEMALASGVAIPTVYVMDDEPGINAFAAGFSPNEAVIGVNRGTMDLLTRDELQGVVAHEFSHILNGDMRMNLRLIGILFGLQLLALVGYYCMRISYYVSIGSRSSSDKDKGGGAALALVMLLGGLGVMIIGYVGIFFSSIIKAAISRQREFLADASAVQFTRNPDGIAGALKKIGCPNVGSEVKNERAAEASHLFFGNVCSMFSLGNLLATHPDLTMRIQRIDPRFDGRFPTSIAPISFQNEERARKNSLPSSQSALDPLRKLNPLGAMTGTGGMDPARVLAAGMMLDAIPTELGEAARDPLTAKATFYAIVLDRDPVIQRQQLLALASAETDFVVQKTNQTRRGLDSMADELYIPLAQRTASALRQLSPDQYKNFSKALDALIAADQKMSLLEYTLKAILLRDLDIHFGLSRPLSVKYRSIALVKQEFSTVLAYLAYSGHDDPAEAKGAFASAQQGLKLAESMPDVKDCTVVSFDKSLRTLAETAPDLKKEIFTAFMTCIHYDGQITVREGELIRAIAAMLAVPMPNFS